jgi:Fic family protein
MTQSKPPTPATQDPQMLNITEVMPATPATNALRQAFFSLIRGTVKTPMDLLPLLEKAFPACNTLPEALAQLDDLKKCLDSFRPLNANQLTKLLEAWDTEYTYESNRIEGNTLTLQETHLVIARGMTIKGKRLDEHLEARNHQEAIYYIRELAEKNTVLSEHLVNSIHSIVLGGIRPREAGIYRKQDVTITGAKHMPPPTYLVQKSMEDIFIWYNDNKDTLHPVLLASDMHEKIVTVHPWIDGNGRTCRLVMNLILLQHGYPIARIAGDDEARLDYYNDLEVAQIENNSEPFQKLVAAYVKKSLFEFLSMVSGNADEDAQEKGRYFFERMQEIK